MKSDRPIYAAWIAGTAAIIALLAGCATLKADAKSAAERVQAVCGPQVMPDALVAVPLVATLADCEYRREDCTGIKAQLVTVGGADVQACAYALLHFEAVNLAADAGTP